MSTVKKKTAKQTISSKLLKVNSKRRFKKQKKEVSLYKKRRIIRQHNKLMFKKKLREEGMYQDAQPVAPFISK